jgi:hypothetical protein
MKVLNSFMIILSLIFLPISANAGLVKTNEVFAVEQNLASFDTVNSFINNKEVLQKYTEMGINPTVANERINSLTSDEINLLAGEINSLPAGGYISETGGVIIGVTLIILVWIISKN